MSLIKFLLFIIKKQGKKQSPEMLKTRRHAPFCPPYIQIDKFITYILFFELW